MKEFAALAEHLICLIEAIPAFRVKPRVFLGGLLVVGGGGQVDPPLLFLGRHVGRW